MKNLDARTKFLVLLIALIICVTTPPHAYFGFAGYFVVLTIVAVFVKVEPRKLLRNQAAVAPLIILCAVCVPFFHSADAGGAHSWRAGLMLLLNVSLKSIFGVTAVTLFAAVTPVADLLIALERLRCPRLIVMTTAFMHRYMSLLLEELRRMKRARESRCGNMRWIWHAGQMGQVVGTLFLRSYERGERVYLALLARGYRGRFYYEHDVSLRGKDYAAIAVTLVVFLSFRIFS